MFNLHPKSLGLHQGGKRASPQELTQVSDWGERSQPTPMQFQG
ncbi:addiction module toxin RelE [Serratia marcescens]|uniref:Addiction module toxin RelE n=1 Tax=Serratia marcescens TaxID=615 RepID=A0AB33G4J6_SERMA|nr:addiction module toxin RelE [Serratia marcescens]AUY13072.1 addiction module toxin RelE [Serratia sp. SSNIH1]POU54657.1 addiction module toxin RelE [Serratia sp. SSNIH4]POW39353.1 addiction module toxin RelE [Serratia sp. SSNIH2]POW40675.1 addiction module toxin RelE [Serratia sp. SSNIH5]POW61554.1 addiction module toxin RelE [Serratia sp. SSNIH3]